MLKPKLLWILGVALLLALVALWAEHQRAEKWESRAKAAETQITGLGESLKSKDVLIDQFQQQAEAATALANAEIKRMNLAAQRAAQLKSELEATRRQLEALERADEEIPQCEQLLDRSLSVCPGTVRSMLERANRGLQGQDSEGAAAGARGDQPPADSGLPAPHERSGEPDGSGHAGPPLGS